MHVSSLIIAPRRLVWAAGCILLSSGFVGALVAEGLPGRVIVDDTWATGVRDVQNLPERSAWFVTSAERFTPSQGSVSAIMEGSSRMWVTYFTNGSAQALDEGESLRATWVFRPIGVSAENTNRGFRVGLFNFEEGTRLEEDGFSAGGANGTGVTGYLLNTNFAATWGLNNPMELRRRSTLDNVNLMGAVGAFSDPLATGGGLLGGTGFTSDQTYTLVFEVERVAEGANVSIRISDGAGWTAEVSALDPSPVIAFDTFAIRPEVESRTAAEFILERFTVEYFGDSEDPIIPEPMESLWAGTYPEVADGFRYVGMGWIWDAEYPWVYHFNSHTWLYLYDEVSSLDSIIAYAFAEGGFTFFTADFLGDWIFIFDLGEWATWGELPLLALRDRFKPQLTPHDAIPEGMRTFFVATDGNNAAVGSEEAPFRTLAQAVSVAQPGDVLVMRGGVYSQTGTITIGTNRNGTASNRITLINYPGEEPILDFTGQNLGTIGLRINASNWNVVGLTVRNAGHNGIRMDGSHNRLERIVAHNNHDTGIHMAGSASHNLILNCDSYRNFNTTGRVGNNADGFGAKFDNLGPGNYFYGCRAWENSDDGYDFWRASHTITVENSWAFGNGDASVFGNPANFEGGGNGFKLGGDRVAGDHIVIRCVAFDNFGANNNAKGFDHNNNTGALTLIHNTAFNNGRNFTFPNNPVDGTRHIFQNNLSVFPGSVQVPSGSLQEGNSWQVGFVTADMMQSVDTSLAKSPRQPDGSLPVIPLLRPLPGTLPVNAGVDIGWFFNGIAPDMGAYELDD